jgi:YggT family protein
LYFVLAQLINTLANLLTLLVIVSVILSWFMSPYHPLREALDRLVDPMLMPIRRFVPPLGGLDFSPMILILLIELVAWLLNTLIRSL